MMPVTVNVVPGQSSIEVGVAPVSNPLPPPLSFGADMESEPLTSGEHSSAAQQQAQATMGCLPQAAGEPWSAALALGPAMQSPTSAQQSPVQAFASPWDVEAQRGGQQADGVGTGGAVQKRTDVLKKLNDFGIGAKPGLFGKTLLSQDAIEKTIKPKITMEVKKGQGDSEDTPMLSGEDHGHRVNRVLGFDKSCQDIFQKALAENVGFDLREMTILPDERELAYIEVVAMMGAPFEDGKTEVLGKGAVILVENEMKKHRLIFSISEDMKGVEASERWSLSKKAGTEHVTGDGNYSVTRGQDAFVGFFHVEGSLFDVQVKRHDEAILKAIFSAERIRLKQEVPCCECLENCFKSCFVSCAPCFSSCKFTGCLCCQCAPPDPDLALADSWSLSAQFSENMKDLIEAKIQTSTNDASYKFPDCPCLTNPEERAMLVEFTRSVKLKYLNPRTSEVQLCTLLVHPSVPYAKIVTFASMLSAQSSIGSEQKGGGVAVTTPSFMSAEISGKTNMGFIEQYLQVCGLGSKNKKGQQISKKQTSPKSNKKRCCICCSVFVVVFLMLNLIVYLANQCPDDDPDCE